MYMGGHWAAAIGNLRQYGKTDWEIMCRLELASNCGRVGSDKGFAHRMRSLLSIHNSSEF